MTDALMPTYARQDIAFTHGEGARLYATDGREFIDFAAGVAVNSLGHAHPKLLAALKEQADRLWHVSNLWRVPEAERLADRLCASSFADVAFFANSGAEAVEAAIKTARKHFAAKGQPQRWHIITFKGAFHGRTLATIAAAGNARHLEGFGEPCGGFTQVAPGDIAALAAAITDHTAAVMLEPVQGESGVRPFGDEFLRQVRALCDERGLLLIFDEVQTGIGRTGRLFAHEHAGVAPDIMALAKGLGGGFPIGACLATADAAAGMTAGTHGSTFGGNPLAMAVANAVLDVVADEAFLTAVRAKGERLKARLEAMRENTPNLIAEVRGRGLMLGLACIRPVAEVIAAALEQGVLLVPSGDGRTARLLPPLTITDEEIDEGLNRLQRALAATSRG